MKTTLTSAKILLLGLAVAVSQNIFAQEKMEIKGKKITITEKEVGSADGKTNLEIATNDLTPAERATLIQSLMNIKGSKIETKQEVANSANAGTAAANTGKKITITEKADGATSGKTNLEIATNDLNAEERASIIQSLMNIKGSKIEMKQERANTAKLASTATTSTSELPVPLHIEATGKETISGLQLYPNPNNSQFHLVFNTGQQADVTLRMMDVGGKLVYSDIVKDASGKLDKDIYIRPALPSGTYVLEATANGQKITTQVVVQ